MSENSKQLVFCITVLAGVLLFGMTLIYRGCDPMRCAEACATGHLKSVEAPGAVIQKECLCR